jgi:hypothetical protein
MIRVLAVTTNCLNLGWCLMKIFHRWKKLARIFNVTFMTFCQTIAKSYTIEMFFSKNNNLCVSIHNIYRYTYTRTTKFRAKAIIILCYNWTWLSRRLKDVAKTICRTLQSTIVFGQHGHQDNTMMWDCSGASKCAAKNCKQIAKSN